MALHALWDCSTFLHAGRGGVDLGLAVEAAAPAIVMPFLLVLTLVAAIVVLRRGGSTTPAPTAA